MGGDYLSRKIAFAGVFTGMSVVLLYLGAMMPTGKVTLYFLASLPVAFTIIEAGAGAGAILYVAVCILAGFTTGNIYGVIPFAFFFGHYPIFKFLIEKKRKALFELLLKLAVFNSSMLLWYVLFRSIFMESLPAALTGGGLLPAALFAVLQLVFLIYDYTFSGLIYFYETRLEALRRK